MNNSLNKLLPVGKKLKKYLPFFIGFKLLTFTGFLSYIMPPYMRVSLGLIVFDFLYRSFCNVFNFDIRFDSLKDKHNI